MNARARDASGAPGRSLARAMVSQVQVLGLASAAAVVERYVGTLDDAVDGPPAGPALPRIHGPRPAGPLAPDVVELPTVSPGARTTASVWVHNPTAAPVAVTLRASGMVHAAGDVIPADAVVVVPSAPATVQAGGSVAMRLAVRVPSSAPPGHYHAVLTSTATPAQALPVHLEVREDGA